ncbi:HupE / UreJ protein [Cnuella takakiae]|uniref:HupE / UreJ protein n=1 Tax=Cnuella takakiae TaxID=1302690 RepID=A0A1M5A9N6_9BACT|nr:HupE/UreJ family protein [Cnuella takakiae]OLY92045.1 HupE / UreJ protein [Cnuella takakiae]SHF26875.1 HupE / UreJ protein [Cnuella takakiae]
MSDFSFYFSLGWEHIMSIDALDHILFVLVLAAIYLLQDWKKVLVLVTAFTIGHSITLALSALHIISVPTALVEFLIPCTIVITAVSNLFQKSFNHRAIRLNYFLALFFGLIHGLGFANTLRFILAQDQSLAWALFGFNVGLEAGQVIIVTIILLLSHFFVQVLKVPRREWVLFISAAVFSLSLQMALERLPGKEEAEPAVHIVVPATDAVARLHKGDNR